VAEVPEGQGEPDDRPDLVQAELEFGHHPEVATAAPDGPEQVRVLLGRSSHDAPVRGHDLYGQEVVTAQASLAAQPPHPAAEGQPGNAGVADESARCGQRVLLSGRVHLRPPRAAAAAGGSRDRIDADVAEGTQIDHDGVVGDARAGEVVTAASDRQVAPRTPGEPDGGGHVSRGPGPGYHPWPPVDVAVPDAFGADGIVVGVVGGHDPAREFPAERLQLSCQQISHLPPV
jgi:hypothetical protein